MEIGGQEVILERLMRGSIINYKTFFTLEPAVVSLRASFPAIVMQISIESLNKFVNVSDNYQRKLLAH